LEWKTFLTCTMLVDKLIIFPGKHVSLYSTSRKILFQSSKNVSFVTVFRVSISCILHVFDKQLRWSFIINGNEKKRRCDVYWILCGGDEKTFLVQLLMELLLIDVPQLR
jgi:hypothetical protein